MSGHKHQWILVREQIRTVKGKRVKYKFYECVAKNCPNPNRMEIENG